MHFPTRFLQDSPPPNLLNSSLVNILATSLKQFNFLGALLPLPFYFTPTSAPGLVLPAPPPCTPCCVPACVEAERRPLLALVEGEGLEKVRGS